VSRPGVWWSEIVAATTSVPCPAPHPPCPFPILYPSHLVPHAVSLTPCPSRCIPHLALCVAHAPRCFLPAQVIRGDHAQFVRSDELAAAWSIFSPLLHTLERDRVVPIPYPYGSRGPVESDDLIRAVG
jgi:hypothetical protein